MNIWDRILPHRLMINKSLRKESESLIRELDTYKDNYEKKLSECNLEIEKAINRNNNKLKNAKVGMMKELSVYQQKFELMIKLLKEYVDLYYEQQLFKEKQKLAETQMNVIDNEIKTINQKEKLVYTEIESLKKRINILKNESDVSDVVELIKMSDIDCELNGKENPRSLLYKLRKISLDNTSHAMKRLQNIIHEKSEYYNEIKYIEWVIVQKKGQIEEWHFQKDMLTDNKKKVKNHMKEEREKRTVIDNSLWNLSVKIRDCWMVPYMRYELEINDKFIEIDSMNGVLKKRKKELYERMKKAKDESKKMAEKHSNDKDKWNRISTVITQCKTEINKKCEKNYADISKIKDSINQKKEEQKNYIEVKNDVYDMTKRYNINFFKPQFNDEKIRVLNDLQRTATKKERKNADILRKRIIGNQKKKR